MNNLSFDFERARAERDAGMQRAVDHAERECDGWADVAFAYLQSFCAARAEAFISEDVSDAANADPRFPQPPTDRAWGQIYKRAAKAGLIEQVGIGRSRRRHASICPLWRARRAA